MSSDMRSVSDLKS